MIAAWWAVALELALKSAAVLVAASVASLLLRRASAAARHAVWGLAFGSLLLLPALELCLPAWRPAGLPRGSVAVSEVHVSVHANGITAPHRPVRGQSRVHWDMVAFALWISGVMVCLLRWRNGTRQVARLRNPAVPATESCVSELVQEAARQLGLRHPVTLVMGAGETVPMAAGVWRPMILLPADAAHWSYQRLRMVLLHEMAHIRRKDCVMQALAELVFSLYWFNPLVWFAMRRLRIERERACDDLVLCAGNKVSDYAAHLLALSRPLEGRELAPAAIAMASSSHLETRLRSILNPHLDRRAFTPAAAVMACAIAACLLLPLAAMRPQASDARTVSGTVYDAEGAVVPDAAVVVSNAESGQQQTTSTGPAGQFSIGPLSDGLYRLEVNARGFAPAIRRLKVDGQHQLRFDITVDLGSVQETVVVRGKGTPAAVPAGPHRVRVGGNVTPAKLVHQTSPEYPEDAKSRGIQGDVVLRAVILLDGSVGGLTPVGSPDQELTQAAMNAVRQWRYQPSLLNGKPVETVTTITVNFQLEP